MNKKYNEIRLSGKKTRQTQVQKLQNNATRERLKKYFIFCVILKRKSIFNLIIFNFFFLLTNMLDFNTFCESESSFLI